MADTCTLAVQVLRSSEASDWSARFGSVDPAPAARDTRDTRLLASRVTDERQALSQRFSALFALRDLRASHVLAMVLQQLVPPGVGDRDALLAHEVAYVLGQGGQGAECVASLARVVRRADVAAVVRHEAAVALAASGPGIEAEAALDAVSDDPHHLVSCSAAVALHHLRRQQDTLFSSSDQLRETRDADHGQQAYHCCTEVVGASCR